jgi:heat shock protein HslJ
MKKLLLFLVISLLSLTSFAQDPDPALFQTWYLHQIERDQGATLFVSEITPSTVPTLTVSETFEFNGFGSCNDFSGNFSYEVIDGEEMLTPSNYNDTGLTCEFQSHIDFETEYFSYFDSGLGLPLTILNVDSTTLHLEIFPGFILMFKDTPVVLEIEDNQILDFKIYPNPTSNLLFITSEIASIEKIVIYNPSGQLVLEAYDDLSSLDVSVLNNGLYFLQITSEEGSAIQKFIKQ